MLSSSPFILFSPYSFYLPLSCNSLLNDGQFLLLCTSPPRSLKQVVAHVSIVSFTTPSPLSLHSHITLSLVHRPHTDLYWSVIRVSQISYKSISLPTISHMILLRQSLTHVFHTYPSHQPQTNVLHSCLSQEKHQSSLSYQHIIRVSYTHINVTHPSSI